MTKGERGQPGFAFSPLDCNVYSLSICLSLLSFCLSFSLTLCLSLSLYLSFSLSLCLSFSLTLCLSLSLYLSVSLSSCLSVSFSQNIGWQNLKKARGGSRPYWITQLSCVGVIVYTQNIHFSRAVGLNRISGSWSGQFQADNIV